MMQFNIFSSSDLTLTLFLTWIHRGECFRNKSCSIFSSSSVSIGNTSGEKKYWDQNLSKCVSIVSGPRNWHYGSVSGARNWHYGQKRYFMIAFWEESPYFVVPAWCCNLIENHSSQVVMCCWTNVTLHALH